MKKLLFTLVLSFSSFFSLNAMSYEEARQQALFLTDKMAYELNLNQQQYEYCYEINLDYLLGVVTADDVYGPYLQYRNADLRSILYDWQYSLFVATDYFFRPLAWYAGAWSYPIYRHYNYGHYFYSRPAVYISYRGGHGRYHHPSGYYVSYRPHWNGGLRGSHRGGYGPHGPRPDGYGVGHHGGHRPYGHGTGHPTNHGGGYTIGGGNRHGHNPNHGGGYGNSNPNVGGGHGSINPNHGGGHGNSNPNVGGGHNPGNYNGGRATGGCTGGRSTYNHPSSTRSGGDSPSTRSMSSGGGNHNSHHGSGGSHRGRR